jgi:hypothetical protein
MRVFDEPDYFSCERGGSGLSITPEGAAADSLQRTDLAARRQCVLVSLSRRGGVNYPPKNIREPRSEAEYRTVRLVTISSSVYTAYDVVLERDGCTWEVVEKRSLFEVFS